MFIYNAYDVVEIVAKLRNMERHVSPGKVPTDVDGDVTYRTYCPSNEGTSERYYSAPIESDFTGITEYEFHEICDLRNNRKSNHEKRELTKQLKTTSPRYTLFHSIGIITFVSHELRAINHEGKYTESVKEG